MPSFLANRRTLIIIACAALVVGLALCALALLLVGFDLMSLGQVVDFGDVTLRVGPGPNFTGV